MYVVILAFGDFRFILDFIDSRTVRFAIRFHYHEIPY